MIAISHVSFEIHDGLGCFGGFDKTNTLCRKHCVLRLRCAIEHDRNLRMELFENWMADQDEFTTIQ